MPQAAKYIIHALKPFSHIKLSSYNILCHFVSCKFSIISAVLLQVDSILASFDVVFDFRGIKMWKTVLLILTFRATLKISFSSVCHKCAECDISGDTGDNLHSYLNNAFANEFCFPHIQVIYPTAPLRYAGTYGNVVFATKIVLDLVISEKIILCFLSVYVRMKYEVLLNSESLLTLIHYPIWNPHISGLETKTMVRRLHPWSAGWYL